MPHRRLDSGGFFGQPFEFAFAIVFLILGASLVLSGFTIKVSPAQVLLGPIVIGWALALGLGGVAIITGLVWSGSGVLSRGIERAGLILILSAWSSYGLAMAFLAPSGTILSVLQAIAICSGCIGRIVALYRVDRAVRSFTARGV